MGGTVTSNKDSDLGIGQSCQSFRDWKTNKKLRRFFVYKAKKPEYRQHVPIYFQSRESAIKIEEENHIYDHSHRLNSMMKFAMKPVVFSAVAERLQRIEQTQSDHKNLLEISQEIKPFVVKNVEVLEGL